MIDLGRITQGERGTLTFTWEFPDNLTSPATILAATITATMRNLDTGAVTAVTGTLTGTAATTVTWALSAEDSGTDGTFAVTFRASVGGVTTYTLEARLAIADNPAVDTVAAPPLVGIDADDAAWAAAGRATVSDATKLANTDNVQARDTDAVSGNAAKLDANGQTVDAGFAFGGLAAIDDAPSDGTQYARKNAAWEAVASSSLSDYSNVIVVDAGGNGDYTTLQAANTAAISGDIVWIFGNVVVSNTRLVLKNGVSFYFAPGSKLTLSDAELVVDTGQSVAMTGHGTIIGANGSYDDGALVFVRGALTISDITVNNTGANIAMQSRSVGSVINANSIRLLTNGSAALVFELVPTSSLYNNCDIQIAASNDPYANGPFYHCKFGATPTNITVASGNYSNIAAGVTWPVIP